MALFSFVCLCSNLPFVVKKKKKIYNNNKNIFNIEINTKLNRQNECECVFSAFSLQFFFFCYKMAVGPK